MKLMELMSLGDDNQLGGVLHAARTNLNKLKNGPYKKHVIMLLATLDNIDTNPNILQTDGYSLLNYLQQIANPKVGERTLAHVCDVLGSYDDSDGD